MEKIILASNNPGKLRELTALLQDVAIKIVTPKDYNLTQIAETGLSFVENAIIKARFAADKTNLAAIADDSGLIVDYLKGAPGIYSARFAGKNATSQENNAKLLSLLADVPEQKRNARFYCVIVYMLCSHDPTPIICQGVWEGRILTRPQGKQGFGYDPVFYVPTHDCSAAELNAEVKNQISHRAQALKQLKTLLMQENKY